MRPLHLDAEIAVLGLNTARPVGPHLNWSHGRINSAQIAHARSVFEPLGGEVFKVVVTHHPSCRRPMAGNPLVGRAGLALRTFEGAGSICCWRGTCTVDTTAMSGHIMLRSSGRSWWRRHPPPHRHGCGTNPTPKRDRGRWRPGRLRRQGMGRQRCSATGLRPLRPAGRALGQGLNWSVFRAIGIVPSDRVRDFIDRQEHLIRSMRCQQFRRRIAPGNRREGNAKASAASASRTSSPMQIVWCGGTPLRRRTCLNFGGLPKIDAPQP